MDARIALGVNPISIPDQSAPLQKALTLNALMGQSDLQGLQIQEAQRGARKNAALDALAGQNLSDEDYMSALSRIDRGAAYKLQKDRLEQQEAQGKVNKSNIEQQGALAAGFASLPTPEARSAAYPALVAQHNKLLMPGQKPLENEPWNEAFLPNLQKFVVGALAPKDALERSDYAATGQPAVPGGSPIVSALGGQPTPIQSTDVDSGATVRALQGIGGTGPQSIAPPQQPVVSPRGNVLLPDQEVVRKASTYTPEDYRAEAKRLRSQNNAVADKRAKEYEEEANRLDQRVLQEQGLEQQKASQAEQIRVREEGIKVRQQNQGNQVITNTGKLADDFRQEQAVKDYRTVQPLIAAMHNASGKNTAASDLDMVYAIAKIFDPGSVVREGEQVMIVNAGGLPSKIQSVIGNLNGGQRLSSELRKELVEQAESRVDNYKQAYDSASESYRGTAKRFNLNPDDIVRDYKVTAKGPMLDKGKGPRGAGDGSRENPFVIKGDDGWSLVPKGQFYTAPDGSIRQKQ